MLQTKEHDFFRIEKRLLKFFGISMTKNVSFSYKIYSYAVILLMNLYTVMVLVDLLTQPFQKALDSWSTFFGFLLGLSMILTTCWRRVEIGELMNTLENGVFVSTVRNNASIKTTLLQQWNKFKNVRMVTIIAVVFITCQFQTLYTLLLRLTKINPNDWKLRYGDITLVNITYSPNFEIIFAYQSVSIFYISISGIICILTVAHTLEYVATQFKILQSDLKTLLAEAMKNAGHYEQPTLQWKFLRNEIKNFVLYHESVIEIVKTVENTFGKTFLLTFIFTLSMNCVDIYRASMISLEDLRTIGIFVEVVVISVQSLLICKSGEKVATESERLRDAAYHIDFVGIERRFQNSLIMILAKTRTPIRIKAGKFIDVSVVTYASILRASYSAYIMLKNVNKGKS